MLRLVTINIWQEQGPWQRRLALLAERLRALDPDVVCLQEVRQVPGRVPNQAHTLARALGMHWTFEPAQAWGGGVEGLALLSRRAPRQRLVRELPFHGPGRSRRVCLGLRLPGEGEGEHGPVWVFTTHLAYRLADGALRERQVLAADALIAGRGDEAPAVLAGDFNAVPEADEIRFLRGLTTLGGRRTYYQDAFARCNPGVPGHTWAADNPYTEALSWLEPDRRLDYVFVTPRRRDGRGQVRSCRMVLRQPDLAGVRCSDHYGLLAEIAL